MLLLLTPAARDHNCCCCYSGGPLLPARAGWRRPLFIVYRRRQGWACFQARNSQQQRLRPARTPMLRPPLTAYGLDKDGDHCTRPTRHLRESGLRRSEAVCVWWRAYICAPASLRRQRPSRLSSSNHSCCAAPSARQMSDGAALLLSSACDISSHASDDGGTPVVTAPAACVAWWWRTASDSNTSAQQNSAQMISLARTATTQIKTTARRNTGGHETSVGRGAPTA